MRIWGYEFVRKRDENSGENRTADNDYKTRQRNNSKPPLEDKTANRRRDPEGAAKKTHATIPDQE